MIINLRLYKKVIPSIKAIIDNNIMYSYGELISISSVSTGAPVIVCAYYVASIVGMNEEIEKNIDFLMKFYKIDEVMYIEEFLKSTVFENEKT